jgi:hypothetical protein
MIGNGEPDAQSIFSVFHQQFVHGTRAMSFTKKIERKSVLFALNSNLPIYQNRFEDKNKLRNAKEGEMASGSGSSGGTRMNVGGQRVE